PPRSPAAPSSSTARRRYRRRPPCSGTATGCCTGTTCGEGRDGDTRSRPDDGLGGPPRPPLRRALRADDQAAATAILFCREIASMPRPATASTSAATPQAVRAGTGRGGTLAWSVRRVAPWDGIQVAPPSSVISVKTSKKLPILNREEPILSIEV